MEKADVKGRTIQFKSGKNERLLTVRSRDARKYAEKLESDETVHMYTTRVRWEQEDLRNVDPLSIRKSYFETAWETDFVIHRMNGSIAVRELAKQEDLGKLASIEKLELSRRYWKTKGVEDWKVVLMK